MSIPIIIRLIIYKVDSINAHPSPPPDRVGASGAWPASTAAGVEQPSWRPTRQHVLQRRIARLPLLRTAPHRGQVRAMPGVLAEWGVWLI